ncbi:MAG: GDSL-type esterase/lipase family protein, partial [Bacteroidota bacterium]|nr:GDSL-type esterase/lipase family protein [Bacteroidota bacterium]
DGVEVINAGETGCTVAEGLTRIDDDVLTHSPDYVLVMFGMDDALAGVKTQNFKADLEKIVDRIGEGKAKVVLLTPPPISERMSVKFAMDSLRNQQAHLSGMVQNIRDLAKERKLPLIDFHRYFLDNHLAYSHLFEGWLPDAVAQTAMAPFAAGELLPMMGVKNYPNPILSDYRKAYRDTSGDPNWKHNAFTDLTFFGGQFYLAFRNGGGHAPPPPPSGRVIVLRSVDGILWEREATLVVSNVDHQADPKFLIVGDLLFVYCATRNIDNPSGGHTTFGFERLAAGEWSEPFKCADGVFWRAKKWRDKYYVAAYARAEKDAAVKMLSSLDGRSWDVVSNILAYETGGNETDLYIENDVLMAYSRCGDGNNHEMIISTYFPEEDYWDSATTGRLIHAPCVFKVGELTMITGRYCSQSDDGFRDLRKDWNAFTSGDDAEMEKADPARVEAYHHGLRTGVFVIDGTRPRLLMELLSAGDSSYPGVVKYGNEYLISDYSMHEYYPYINNPGDWNTPCDIYVSRIRFR